MFKQIKKRSEGFTIVELLIVIVVIGILAALVLNTFQGVQARARDTERKTDINAIHTQLEVYYNDEGYYLATESEINTTNLAGISGDALIDPNDDSIEASAEYVYAAVDSAGAACTNATSATRCTQYDLSAVLEDETDPYTKNSLNRN